jgi:hypothetical protein
MSHLFKAFCYNNLIHEILHKERCKIRFHQSFVKLLAKGFGAGTGYNVKIKGPAQVLRIGKNNKRKILLRNFYQQC